MSSEIDAGALLGAAVQQYQAAVVAYDRETARILGVGENDQSCLELVAGAPEGITPRELADRLGFTTGSVTTMLDRLERKGYVARHAHPTDRRKVLVRPTPVLLERAGTLIAPMLEAATAEVLARFSPDELDVVTRFMRAATANQREHTQLLRATAPYPDMTTDAQAGSPG